jgi:hypothetical protein
MIERDMTDKMQDLEQHIMECWQLVDDVKLLYEQVMDKDLHKDQDRLANALLGLHTIYGMKFERAFNTYEKVLEQYYKKKNNAD